MTNVYAIFDSLPAARIVQRAVADPSLMLGLADVRSDAILMACGALRREHTPAILVLDSDSLEERVILQEEVAIEGVMELYRERIPYRIILAVPQVEAILFADREGFEKALGRKVADEDWFEARFRPRAVFRRLLEGRDYEDAAVEVIKRIDDAALRRMARHPVVQEIREFIAEVRTGSAKRPRLRRVG